MQESFDFDARPRSREAEEPRVLEVRELNALVRELLESRIPEIWVEGEVTGWKRYSSGHCYFCLRDARAQVSAVMFAADARRLPAEPEEGMRVRVLGRVSLYEKRGDFQLVVRRLDATGAGGLWKVAFERLRKKLDAEGLLDPARRHPIPAHPQVIGVVTSPVGAALQDILQIVRRRAPWTRVILSPARVQGDGAASDIARAIQRFERAHTPVDVIIVGRGGGSTEDLWAFNEEIVARAIATCPVPVISAVGHEVDITIADLVADLRAPTPSAAAEHAVPDGAVLRQELIAVRTRLARGLGRYARTRRTQLESLEDRLARSARRLPRRRADQLAWARDRLTARMQGVATARRAQLATLGASLDALSPLKALARGFAVPLDSDGHVLRSAEQFDPGRPFRLRVSDGEVACRVEDATDE